MKKRDYFIETVRRTLEPDHIICVQGRDKGIFTKLEMWNISWTCVTIQVWHYFNLPLRVHSLYS